MIPTTSDILSLSLSDGRHKPSPLDFCGPVGSSTRSHDRVPEFPSERERETERERPSHPDNLASRSASPTSRKKIRHHKNYLQKKKKTQRKRFKPLITILDYIRQARSGFIQQKSELEEAKTEEGAMRSREDSWP